LRGFLLTAVFLPSRSNEKFNIMGTYLISKRKNGEFQFTLKAGNGQVILTSEGYAAKSACMNGVESVKKNSTEDGRYEKKTASNGKLFFNLKATNGQVIGTSQMYEAEASMLNGIESVKTNGPNSDVTDESAAEIIADS